MSSTPRLLDTGLIVPLREAARVNPRRRMNLNLHAGPQEACQRFFNALEADSYVPPHRHLAAGKEETMVVVQGGMGLLVFDDEGRVTAGYRLEAGSERFGIHIPLACWHSVVALDEGCVFLEAKGGPYQPLSPDEMAPWAPPPGSAEAADYLESLRRLIPAR